MIFRLQLINDCFQLPSWRKNQLFFLWKEIFKRWNQSRCFQSILQNEQKTATSGKLRLELIKKSFSSYTASNQKAKKKREKVLFSRKYYLRFFFAAKKGGKKRKMSPFWFPTEHLNMNGEKFPAAIYHFNKLVYTFLYWKFEQVPSFRHNFPKNSAPKVIIILLGYINESPQWTFSCLSFPLSAPSTFPTPGFFRRQHIKLLLNEADGINFSSQLFHSLIDRDMRDVHGEKPDEERCKFNPKLISQIRIAS